MNEADLIWLETVDLPPMSWQEACAYHRVQWDESRPPNALFDAIEAFRLRYDGLGRLDWACADPKRPIEERERIARAFFRVAAWEALVSNECCEGQKAWAVTLLKKKSQHADRFLAIWMASQDPHAALVRALRGTMPEASAIEIARVVEEICDGWRLAYQEDLSKAELKTLVKRFAALASTPGVVDAILKWLPDVGDLERRVLHVGAVLASDGSKRCAAALRPILAEARKRDWGAVWSPLAPKGSAVRALLDD